MLTRVDAQRVICALGFISVGVVVVFKFSLFNYFLTLQRSTLQRCLLSLFGALSERTTRLVRRVARRAVYRGRGGLPVPFFQSMLD